MIVATAGHVDHGKTQLVKALTGVDTDTLDEEKKRGLTIDIGFAYLPLGNGENIGFIDVPGHSRFMRNAICGLAATDFVLFVVAADDGVMPQTEEHLAVIDLLKVERGAIAISKTDGVSIAQLEIVKQQVNHFVENTMAAEWPIFSVSSLSNEGIGVLRDYLVERGLVEKQGDEGIQVQDNFRMPIDRVFSLKGVGLIATGTIFAGKVQQGDTVTIAGSNKRLRVRGLKIQNSDAEFGMRGQRCAINLAGSELQKGSIKRGSWVTAEIVSDPVYRFDAEIRILDSVDRSLKHWTPVHLHHAASESTARVAVLESQAIRPSTSGLVQIVCDHPVGASFGDFFIIRDQSAKTTLGGGKVIDIFPPKRGRARPERIQFLKLSNCDDTETVLQNLIKNSPNGVDLNRFAGNRNLTPEAASDLVALLDMQVVSQGGSTAGYSRQFIDQLDNNSVSKPQLNLAEDDGWMKIEKALNKEGIRGMSIGELTEAVELSLKQLSSMLACGSYQGLVVKLSDKLFVLPQYLALLNDKLKFLVQQSDTDGFSIAAFRKATGVGRNRAIEILECFDNQGVTRRVDQHRVLLPVAERRFDQLFKNHQTEGKDRTLVGRPVFKTGGGR